MQKRNDELEVRTCEQNRVPITFPRIDISLIKTFMKILDSPSSISPTPSSSSLSATRTRHEILAGAFAGAVARLLTAPFDVLKIRFQLQSPTEKKYVNVWQSFQSIAKEEGK